MKLNKVFFPLFLISYYLLHASPVGAVCPVCTVAVGAGLGLSRYFGIDDLVSSVWIGGLLMSISFWSTTWLKKRFPNIKYAILISVVLWYGITLIPLWLANVIGHSGNTAWGIDKIVLGTVIGTILFILSVVIDKLLRSKNNGKVFVPYQKVIIPVSLLTMSSLLMYFLI